MTYVEEKGKVSKKESVISNQTRMGRTLRASDTKIRINEILPEDWAAMEAYFRYAPISVITLCDQRNELNLQFQQGAVRVFNGPAKREQP